jgi:hypothetical protein
VIKKLLSTYANNLYQDVMFRAYQHARSDILHSLPPDGKCLDCGAGEGGPYQQLRAISNVIVPENYVGIEWNVAGVLQAKNQGLNVMRGDLNRGLPFKDESFECIFRLSVLSIL